MFNHFLVFSKNELIYLLSILIIGIIIGATGLNLIVGQHLDHLILENNELKNKLEEQKKQLENPDKYQQHYIKTIKVFLETDLNKHTQQKIKEKILKQLEGLYGRKTDQLDPLLLRDIIHGRFISIGDKYYHLELIYIVISTVNTDQIQFYIKAQDTGPEEETE